MGLKLNMKQTFTISLLLCCCFIAQEMHRHRMQSSIRINMLPQVHCAHSFISFNYYCKLALKAESQLRQLILNQHYDCALVTLSNSLSFMILCLKGKCV